MKGLILALLAIVAVACATVPAQAGGGLFSRRNVQVQRVVVRQQQHVVRQQVVVQKVVAQQVVVAQPVVAYGYSQQIVQPVCHAAPIVQQQVVPGCAAFFAK